MKTATVLILRLIAICPALTAGAVEINLVVNGGFESPGVSGYTTFTAPSSFQGWTVASGAVDIVANNFYAPAVGVQSLDLNSVASGSIFQNVATMPSRAYLVSFAFATNPLPDDPRFPAPAVKVMGVRWNGMLKGQFSQNSTGHTATNVGWQDYSLSVVGTGADTLSFASLTPGSAGPALDNIRLVAVPESKSWCLLFAAVCFVAGFSRQHHRFARL
jgi:choice-of-anchor C domain-containing protein